VQRYESIIIISWSEMTTAERQAEDDADDTGRGLDSIGQ
jgi:hypothetical protein